MTPTVVLIPGWQNSGPDHGQSIWEREHPDYVRVRQRDWEHPDRDEWVATFDATLATLPGPAVLAAHSLGCATVAHWAQSHSRPVRGALLVTPPDVERPDVAALVPGWSPLPLAPLPFPTVLVASADDPFCAPARARQLATAWGSTFVNIGHFGHINADAGLGPWSRGEALLAELLRPRA